MVRDEVLGALRLSWVLLLPYMMEGCQSSRETENSGILGIWVERNQGGCF